MWNTRCPRCSTRAYLQLWGGCKCLACGFQPLDQTPPEYSEFSANTEERMARFITGSQQLNWDAARVAELFGISKSAVYRRWWRYGCDHEAEREKLSKLASRV